MEVVGSGQQKVEVAGAGEQNVMEEEHKVGRRSEQAEMKVVGSGQQRVEAVGAGEQNVMKEEHKVGRRSEQAALEVVGSSHQKVEAMVGDVEQNVAEQHKLGSEQDVPAGDEMQVLPQGEKDKLKADEYLTFLWDRFESWKYFRSYYDLKLMAAGDVLETMQMHLCYHLHNSECAKVVQKANLLFIHFQNGINSVSYPQLVWQKFRKEKIQNWVKHEHEWIEFCMRYAEERKC
jgi:hypothetical protein